MESGIRAVPEMKEGWTRRSYEYRNAAGELMCTASLAVEHVEAQNESGTAVTLEVVRGMSLYGPKPDENGVFPSVDVFAVAGLHEEGRVNLIVAGAREAMYIPDERIIVTREPKDPVALAIFLHEAGHAEQYAKGDALGEAINAELRLTNVANTGEALETSMALDKLLAMLPDANIPGVGELRQQVEEIAAEIMSARLRSDSNALWKIRREGFAKRFRALMLGGTMTKLREMMTKLKERDANARALGWMRRIREVSGIDLFEPTVIAHEDSMEAAAAGTCENGKGEFVLTNPREQLKVTLGTYKAGPREMRRLSKSGKEIPKPRFPDEEKRNVV